jgi:hypothetical protein
LRINPTPPDERTKDQTEPTNNINTESSETLNDDITPLAFLYSEEI